MQIDALTSNRSTALFGVHCCVRIAVCATAILRSADLQHNTASHHAASHLCITLQIRYNLQGPVTGVRMVCGRLRHGKHVASLAYRHRLFSSSSDTVQGETCSAKLASPLACKPFRELFMEVLAWVPQGVSLRTMSQKLDIVHFASSLWLAAYAHSFKSSYLIFLLSCSCIAVYVLDPKILFSSSPSEYIRNSQQNRRSNNTAAPFVQVILPKTFLPKLSEGQFQLGEMDDPGNSWVFGQEGELFEQKLLGSHKVTSGFTSIITAEAFDELQRGADASIHMKLPSWSDFTKFATGHDVQWPHPQLQSLFLFAGTMVESDMASVYQNPSSGESVTGLVISTNAESID